MDGVFCDFLFALKKNLPRKTRGEICGWVSKYREINFPTQY